MAQERTWTVGADAEGNADRMAMHQLWADLESVLYRAGGTLNVVADRQELGEVAEGVKVYRTIGYVVQWRSFAPARPAPREAAEPAGDADPDGD